MQNNNINLNSLPLPQLVEELLVWVNNEINSNFDFKNEEVLNELLDYLKKIKEEGNYSKESYEMIQSILRELDRVPLKMRRMFNASRMDNYTMYLSSMYFETIDDLINLEMMTSRFQGNITKFHFNPFPLTKTTRKFFTHLQTQRLYHYTDEIFEDGKIIKHEIVRETYHILNERENKMLQQWSYSGNQRVVFDSDIDDWSIGTSVFTERVSNKRILLVIEDEDGEIFGYHFSNWMNGDHFGNGAFIFVNKPREGKKPIKYLVTDLICTPIPYYDKDDDILFSVGDIVMYKKEMKEKSYCYEYMNRSQRHISNEERKREFFIPKRFMAIHCPFRKDENGKNIYPANQPVSGIILCHEDIDKYDIGVEELFSSPFTGNEKSKRRLINPNFVKKMENHREEMKIIKNQDLLYLRVFQPLNQPFIDRYLVMKENEITTEPFVKQRPMIYSMNNRNPIKATGTMSGNYSPLSQSRVSPFIGIVKMSQNGVEFVNPEQPLNRYQTIYGMRMPNPMEKYCTSSQNQPKRSLPPNPLQKMQQHNNHNNNFVVNPQVSQINSCTDENKNQSKPKPIVPINTYSDSNTEVKEIIQIEQPQQMRKIEKTKEVKEMKNKPTSIIPINQQREMKDECKTEMKPLKFEQKENQNKPNQILIPINQTNN